MRKNRSKVIRKLVQSVDVGMLSAISREWGSVATKMTPTQLYRSGKTLWKRHHPSTKTWGKIKMDVAKLAKEIEERQQKTSTVSRSALTVEETPNGHDLPEQV